MQKGTWLLSILGIIIIILVGILIFVPAKQSKNNQPTSVEGIQIASPKANEEVSFPIKIIGTVNGNGWAGFEGQVGMVSLVSNGALLAEVPLTATSEWTSLPINFSAEIPISLIECKKAPCFSFGPANLVFRNENPSDMRDKDKTFTLPINLSQNETSQISVFFGNMSLSATSEQDECKRVYKINRSVDKTTAVAKAAIEELLKGPTDVEKAQGYFTSIPAGSKLNSISIVNGEARADFNEVTESGGGSCSMASRYAQIEKTLMQFSTITSIKLSINGRTGDIFQP
jgi:hypothetical protein